MKMSKIRPLTVLMFGVATHQVGLSQDIGAWHVSLAGDRIYAMTLNDSGNLMGFFCFSDSTKGAWALGTKHTCEAGKSYSVLVGTDIGAIPLNLLCRGPLGNTGLFRQDVSEGESFYALIEDANRVAIAVPMMTDDFRVLRFRLNGAATAVRAVSHACRSSHDRGPTGTKDLTL